MSKDFSPNRRTILKSTGAAAATFTLGVSPVSGGSYATKHRVSLPKLISGDKVIKKHSVPKKWDAHRRVAKQVINDRNFLDRDGIYSKGLGHSPKEYDGKNGLQITLKASPNSKGGVQISDG